MTRTFNQNFYEALSELDKLDEALHYDSVAAQSACMSYLAGSCLLQNYQDPDTGEIFASGPIDAGDGWQTEWTKCSYIVNLAKYTDYSYYMPDIKYKSGLLKLDFYIEYGEPLKTTVTMYFIKVPDELGSCTPEELKRVADKKDVLQIPELDTNHEFYINVDAEPTPIMRHYINVLQNSIYNMWKKLPDIVASAKNNSRKADVFARSRRLRGLK